MRLLHWQPPCFTHSPRSSWKGDVDVEFPSPSVRLRQSTVTFSRSSWSLARVWNTARCETEWCEERNPATRREQGRAVRLCECVRVCVWTPSFPHPSSCASPLAHSNALNCEDIMWCIDLFNETLGAKSALKRMQQLYDFNSCNVKYTKKCIVCVFLLY